jgi:hypothetical protein
MSVTDYHEDIKPGRLRSRFILVQKLTDQFWANWHKFYFPTLIIRAKWHTARRNVRQGDVCLLQETDAFRADWKLCIVNEIYPDAKGNVRNVEVKVMTKQDGSSSYKPGQPNYLKRHVNHLILLVPMDEEEEGPEQTQAGAVDVAVQAVQEAQDQDDVAFEIKAASTAIQSRSASQDSCEEQGQVAVQGDDEALPQPCQVDEELGGDCSRGRRKTTRRMRNTAAIRHAGLTEAAVPEL